MESASLCWTDGRTVGCFVRRFNSWSVRRSVLNSLPPASERLLLRIWLCYFVTLSNDCLIYFFPDSSWYPISICNGFLLLILPFFFLLLLLFLLSRSSYLRVMKAHDGASRVQPFRFVNVRHCQYFFAADFPLNPFIYWTDTISLSVIRGSVRDDSCR